MPGLKDLRVRIKAIKNTQQITRAMKMVASAKFKRAEQQTLKYRNFKKKIEDITLSLALRCDIKEHFLLDKNSSNTIGIVVVTSDRGLCGAFNSLLLKELVRYINELKQQDKNYKLWVIGRKGATYLTKRNYQVEKSFVGVYRTFDIKVADKIANELIDDYKQGNVGSILVLYNHYKSILKQNITFKKLAPVVDNIDEKIQQDAEFKNKMEGEIIDYLYEPSEVAILEQLLPMYISSEIYSALLESYVGELASRMTAMDNVTNNCVERLRILTIQYNRMRQAAITKEISEIVGGANALEQ
ncbi:MAG TPA: ATP synthase F1 subunit gamma [bacterium]|nr:ATP synthase F1 subunit gamma [bacterium]